MSFRPRLSASALCLGSALCLTTATAVIAGDTVTDNMPGGAVQLPGIGATMAQLNGASPALPPPLISPDGRRPPTASGLPPALVPGAQAPAGAFTLTSRSGRSFSTASPFISRVLGVYSSP